MFIHNDLLARLAPEFRIDTHEAGVLAERLAAYLRHTSIRMDPKTKDFYLLVSVLAIMEGPRVSRMMARKSAAREAAKVATEAGRMMGQPNVVPIQPMH